MDENELCCLKQICRAAAGRCFAAAVQLTSCRAVMKLSAWLHAAVAVVAQHSMYEFKPHAPNVKDDQAHLCTRQTR
jgi:hypothetical protein